MKIGTKLLCVESFNAFDITVKIGSMWKVAEEVSPNYKTIESINADPQMSLTFGENTLNKYFMEEE